MFIKQAPQSLSKKISPKEKVLLSYKMMSKSSFLCFTFCFCSSRLTKKVQTELSEDFKDEGLGFVNRVKDLLELLLDYR